MGFGLIVSRSTEPPYASYHKLDVYCTTLQPQHNLVLFSCPVPLLNKKDMNDSLAPFGLK
ncbi:hypothetical protein I7I48_10210 [Histoplasma ohiense]|nr:hypothetical protein I7I48_10210 [Histoplasma ohiense (nom. inval.)]